MTWQHQSRTGGQGHWWKLDHFSAWFLTAWLTDQRTVRATKKLLKSRARELLTICCHYAAIMRLVKKSGSFRSGCDDLASVSVFNVVSKMKIDFGITRIPSRALRSSYRPNPLILPLSLFSSLFLGSGPDRGRSPVEWEDFLSVRTFVRPSPPLGHPARP